MPLTDDFIIKCFMHMIFLVPTIILISMGSARTVTILFIAYFAGVCRACCSFAGVQPSRY